MAKPSTKPAWMLAYSGADVVEPSGGKKAAGFAADERVAYEYLNYLLQVISEWIEYLESMTDAPRSVIQAVIASGSTAVATNASFVKLTAGGAQAINLHTAVGYGGKRIAFKKIDGSFASTITAFGSELIDEAGTYVMSEGYTHLEIISDNANWLIIAAG